MTTTRQMTDLEIYQAARIEALENQLKIANDIVTGKQIGRAHV